MGFYAVADSGEYVILAETPLGNYALKEKNIDFLKEKHGIDLYDFVDPAIVKTVNITETKCGGGAAVEIVCSTLIAELQLGFVIQFGRFWTPEKTRYCFSELMGRLESGVDNRVTILYGTRRTGKTVLMQQAVNHLTDLGIPGGEIAFVTVQKDKIDGDLFCKYMLVLMRLGVRYLFIDELTYVTGDVNWVSLLSDNTPGLIVVLSATDSLMLRELTRTVLFERTNIIHTTYVSYEEAAFLYQGLTVKDYMRNGGILMSSEEYQGSHETDFERYQRHGLDYIGSAIVDNIVNCFNKFDLCTRYPGLNRMSDQRLRTFLFKWLQRYALVTVLRPFNQKLKSADIGNLLDCVSKGQNAVVAKVDRMDIESELTKRLTARIGVEQFADYTQEELDEVAAIVGDLGCTVLVGDILYLIPVALRYGYAYETIVMLLEEYHDVCEKLNLAFSPAEAKKIIQDTVEGILLEGVITVDLYKSGHDFWKWRDRETQAEIDLVIGQDLYEIKHGSKVELYQCRWLVFSGACPVRDVNSRNLLTLSQEEKDIICTEYEVMEAVFRHKQARGESTEDIMKYLEVADKETKYTIHCINVENFLKTKCQQKTG